MNIIKIKIEKRIKRIVQDVFWRERKQRNGVAFPNVTYYVVRRASKVQGLFSYVFTNLVRIDEAVKKGYIPIVDMMNYKNSFLEDEQIGDLNAWELFFEQPMNVNLDSIKEAKHVLIGHGGVPAFVPNTTEEFLHDTKLFEYWKNAVRKYVRLNASMKDYIKKRKAEIIPPNSRVVGVLGRGTDYTATKPYMHPIQPEVSDLIKKTIEVMEMFNCDYVFLATEDEGVYRQFKKAFGDKLIINQEVRYENTGKTLITQMHTGRKNDRFLTGRDYLTSIIILSECNCFVAGKTGGSLAVMMFNDEFDYSYLFDLGFYGKKENEKWNIRG